MKERLREAAKKNTWPERWEGGERPGKAGESREKAAAKCPQIHSNLIEIQIGSFCCQSSA